MGTNPVQVSALFGACNLVAKSMLYHRKSPSIITNHFVYSVSSTVDADVLTQLLAEVGIEAERGFDPDDWWVTVHASYSYPRATQEVHYG